MHLEAEATLTQERLRKFHHWNYYRKDYSRKIAILVATLVTLNACVSFFVAGTWNLSVLALLVLMVLLLVLLVVYPAISARGQFRRHPAQRLTSRYVFGDDGFDVVNDGDPDYIVHASVKYEALSLVVEQAELFYFFTERNQAFIVWKYDFTEGDVDELGRFLAERLGPKYAWDR
jgi:hypothetical protein